MFNQSQVKVALIDNSLDPSVYTPEIHWTKYFSVPWKSFRAVEGEWPSLEEDFTHFLLTGSEASILERDEWVGEEVTLVREIVAAGYPLLGSCWGHQLLAFSLVGEKAVSRCTQPEIGWLKINLTRASSLLGEEDFYTFTIHFDEVVSLDDRFEILASTSACPIQAFQLRGQPVWGIQFHPEIDIEEARQLLQRMIDRGGPSVELFRKVLTSVPRDSGRIQTIVNNFLAAAPQKPH